MKRKYISYIAAFLITCNFTAKAQFVLKEADTQFELYNYSRAKVLYLDAYKKKQTLHATERLAIINTKTKNYVEAEEWYAKAVKLSKDNQNLVLDYAKALQYNSKYAEAKIEYQKHISLNKNVSEQQKAIWLTSCDSALVWIANPKLVEVTNLSKINGNDTDYGTVKVKNGIVFVSDRGEGKTKSNTKKAILRFDRGYKPNSSTYGWTGESYLSMYYADDNQKVTVFNNYPVTDYHMGVPTFNVDETEMIFTLTRIPKDLVFDDQKIATVKVEIYTSKKDSVGNWTKPEAFAYNNINQYSVGDPFLADDGNSLFFVSDMPGGKGGLDIYKSKRTADGKWSKPENVLELNSFGNERTPFIDQLGNVYFSSDGRVGMGELDIFQAIKKGEQFEISNIGYPFNTPQDDFAFSVQQIQKQQTGYLSSNRFNGKGNDDIYQFLGNIALPPVNILLEGIVYDKMTGKPLTNATVSLAKKDGTTVNVDTDEKGYYKFEVKKDEFYNLLASKESFSKADTTLQLTDSKKQDFYLSKFKVGQIILIDNIHYDFDKYDIRPDAAKELDKLVKVLLEYPMVTIELGSHTDSRGSDVYNIWLSQKRAEYAVNYIISKGVESNRIVAKGYGETVHVNNCSNGVACTEAQHQLNRRTEIKITSVNNPVTIKNIDPNQTNPTTEGNKVIPGEKIWEKPKK